MTDVFQAADDMVLPGGNLLYVPPALCRRQQKLDDALCRLGMESERLGLSLEATVAIMFAVIAQIVCLHLKPHEDETILETFAAMLAQSRGGVLPMTGGAGSCVIEPVALDPARTPKPLQKKTRALFLEAGELMNACAGRSKWYALWLLMTVVSRVLADTMSPRFDRQLVVLFTGAMALVRANINVANFSAVGHA